jgi:hypothetical protein
LLSHGWDGERRYQPQDKNQVLKTPPAHGI